MRNVKTTKMDPVSTIDYRAKQITPEEAEDYIGNIEEPFAMILEEEQRLYNPKDNCKDITEPFNIRQDDSEII